jgi:ABC-type enterochelin transport system permease subunit
MSDMRRIISKIAYYLASMVGALGMFLGIIYTLTITPIYVLNIIGIALSAILLAIVLFYGFRFGKRQVRRVALKAKRLRREQRDGHGTTRDDGGITGYIG